MKFERRRRKKLRRVCFERSLEKWLAVSNAAEVSKIWDLG